MWYYVNTAIYEGIAEPIFSIPITHTICPSPHPYCEIPSRVQPHPYGHVLTYITNKPNIISELNTPSYFFIGNELY
jgi:hypothetical protein